MARRFGGNASVQSWPKGVSVCVFGGGGGLRVQTILRSGNMSQNKLP